MHIGVRNALGTGQIGRVLRALGPVRGRNDGELADGWQESGCLIASWERERTGVEGWFCRWLVGVGVYTRIPFDRTVTRDPAHTASRNEQYAVVEDAAEQYAK